MSALLMKELSTARGGRVFLPVQERIDRFNCEAILLLVLRAFPWQAQTRPLAQRIS